MNSPDPARTTARRQTKNATQEEGRVESQSTSNEIGRKTPESGANDQAYKQGTGGETNIRLRDAEFHRQGG